MNIASTPGKSNKREIPKPAAKGTTTPTTATKALQGLGSYSNPQTYDPGEAKTLTGGDYNRLQNDILSGTTAGIDRAKYLDLQNTDSSAAKRGIWSSGLALKAANDVAERYAPQYAQAGANATQQRYALQSGENQAGHAGGMQMQQATGQAKAQARQKRQQHNQIEFVIIESENGGDAFDLALIVPVINARQAPSRTIEQQGQHQSEDDAQQHDKPAQASVHTEGTFVDEKTWLVRFTEARVASAVSSDRSARAMVTPAEGPSLGMAPEGRWMWMSLRLNTLGLMP